MHLSDPRQDRVFAKHMHRLTSVICDLRHAEPSRAIQLPTAEIAAAESIFIDPTLPLELMRRVILGNIH
jgi:hypothetical protein